MTVIYMVRHAKSAYTPDEMGRGLTEKGKQDAERIARALIEKEIDIIVSSPYRRAIDTVKGLAERKNLKIEMDKRFRERHLSESPVEDFQTAVKAVWEDPDFSYPGGESNVMAAKRGIQGLADILKKYEDKKGIVIGTHGNLMTLIMQYYDPRFNYDFWKNELKMPDIYGLKFVAQKCVDIFHVPFDDKSTNNY